MKTTTLLLKVLILALAGAALVPALHPQATPLTAGAAAAALLLLVLTLASGKNTNAPLPASAPLPPPRPEAELVGLLAVLQEKGRFVDFLMEDVTRYEDAQVGAAARVVHQGCQSVLREHFGIQPMHPAAEGSTVTVPTEHAADEYRLTGNLGGQAPFTGTLVHKGWKATTVKLPRLLAETADRLPAIAPAEVEVQ